MHASKKLIIIAVAIFLLLSFSALFLQSNYVVPILMYHSINYVSAPKMELLTVSPVIFEKQMRFLKEHRYNVLPLEAVAMLLKDKKRIPPRTVAITFDDGFQDNYKYAFPILKKYSFPATIFIIVNEVGKSYVNRLNWNEIIEMKNSGIITFGSHALDAQPLTEIKSDEQLRKQIFVSKEILGKKLNTQVVAFSYAHGSFTPKIRQLIIGAGYKLSVATKRGKYYPKDDIFALRRIRISEKDKNLLLFWFKASGYHTAFSKKTR